MRGLARVLPVVTAVASLAPSSIPRATLNLRPPRETIGAAYLAGPGIEPCPGPWPEKRAARKRGNARKARRGWR